MTKDRWLEIKSRLLDCLLPPYIDFYPEEVRAMIDEVEACMFHNLIAGINSPSVLQDWVEKIPLLAQSALLSALRGPDSSYVPKVKIVTRWIRGLTLVPGDPANVVEFMNSELPERMLEHTAVHKQMETLPQHFTIHLMMALEVIGYYHPDGIVKGHAYSLYTDMRHMFMATPESERAFFSRMENRKWPEDKHPQTVEEAFDLIKKHNAFSVHDLRLLKELQ